MNNAEKRAHRRIRRAYKALDEQFDIEHVHHTRRQTRNDIITFVCALGVAWFVAWMFLYS